MWGAIGALAGLVGGAIYNHWSAQEAMEDQAWYNRDAQIWSARELPSIQLEGMRKAGVNPMLAYGNLGSVAAPSVNAVAADAPDFSSVGSEIGKAVTRNSALKLNAQELENKKSEKNLTEAQAKYYNKLAKSVENKTPPLNPADPVNSARRLGENIVDGVKNLTNLTQREKDEVIDAVNKESEKRGWNRPPTEAEKEAQRRRVREKNEYERRLKEGMENYKRFEQRRKHR